MGFYHFLRSFSVMGVNLYGLIGVDVWRVLQALFRFENIS